MKRNGILNSHIAKVLADLGHTDTIVVADAGLPIPEGVPKIDLSLQQGVPRFLDVVALLKEEMVVEKTTVANEMEQNEEVHIGFKGYFDEVEYISHESLKQQLKNAKAVIRTGEVTPYANCILHAGVTF
ncbi:ribose ABC transporter [Pontibacillus chungwhensis BH030062]|uniref:D-ribose pyranase n=1 Tax=Pontibacillus chungwhensis BH030062 TaxID=1385513 RepID=A0A0A2UU19_9BACI|nr:MULTISPECIES: D-ribose pyranase [Pontibacillus]KGP90253.1 ribose ABC transporter [Pontibacillus chungwhensis BH030062]QST00908.1 D-ribose pyranase [Pontibacillus sp. ALD_SL1]